MQSSINYKEIAQNSIEQTIRALRVAAENIDSSFEHAVRLLGESELVVVTGIGKSGIIAQKIAATLTSTGTRAIFLHPIEALHGDIGIIPTNGCAVICLSKSGNTKELLQLLPFLKQRNCSIIGLLGKVDSSIANFCDFIMNASIQNEACPLNSAPTTSTSVALALGDALAIGVMQYKKWTIEQFSFLHPAGQLGKNMTVKVREIMHSGDKMPVVYSTDNFRTAIIENSRKSLGCVVVMNNEQSLLGIITDGDIRRVIESSDDFMYIPVMECMTKNPSVVSEESLLGEALSIMENREKQISVLPVISQNGRCVGVVRIHDIVRMGIEV